MGQLLIAIIVLLLVQSNKGSHVHSRPKPTSKPPTKRPGINRIVD